MFAATADFLVSAFGAAECAETALALDAECFTVSFCGPVWPAFATAFRGFGLGVDFFADVFGSSFFSVSSNAGFGIE